MRRMARCGDETTCMAIRTAHVLANFGIQAVMKKPAALSGLSFSTYARKKTDTEMYFFFARLANHSCALST